MQRNFKKFAKFAVLCGLAVGIMVHPAFATDAPVRTTEKVVVTAGRIAEKAKTVTQNVTVLDEEFIQKNQHKSLDQLLEQQGIQIVGYSTDTMSPMRVALRGQMSTSDDPNQGYVMVLVNGQRTAFSSLGMIPMVSIERVEVLRGPAAVQYGSMAFGGVVNIITKRGTEQTQASIEIGGGSYETWKAMAGVSGMVGDVDFALGFSHSLRNGNIKDGNGNELYNSEVGGMTMWNANVGYNFANEHRVGMTFMGANFDRMGNNSGTYSTGTYMPNGSDKDTFDDRKNFAIGVDYEGGIKEYGLSWQVKYNYSEDEFAQYSPTYVNPYAKEFEHNSFQSQLSWKYKFLTITGGIDYNKTETGPCKSTSGYGVNPAYELSNVGAFLLAKTAFMDDKLVFSVGGRYDDYTIKVAEERSEDNFSLSAGAAFSPWDWLTFRANVGEAFRMPTGLEAVGYISNWGATYEGNPNLEPEEGFGWDIGFETKYKGFKAGLTYFSMDYEKKFGTRKKANGNTEYYNMPGTTEFRGIEGNISYDLGEAFGWDFMLRPYATFTRMLTYEGPDWSGKVVDIEKVREWTSSFGINYSHPSIGLDVDLSCTYLGEQYEVDYYGPLGNTYVGDNYIVDLSIVKTLYETEDKGKFSAKLDLRNLTDEFYEYSLYYPCPGRSFFLSLIWNY